MNKKLLLTSFIALGFACPAMAEPTNTSSTFPDASQNQYMQEDYTYEGAATETNMAGVYQDNATVYANARYHDAVYALARGKYLPANSETPIDCNQSGYYCEGDQNGVNYSSSAQGLTQCPTGYGNSGTGASANTDCYRTCTTGDVAHSTGTVNGGYYYGDNNQCEPTDCVNGWHVKPGNPDFTTIIGVSYSDEGSGYTANNSTGADSFTSNMSNTIIANDPLAFAVDYGNNKGMIKGHARCSTRSVTTPWGTTSDYHFDSDHFVSDLTDETGQNGAQYCYCHLDSYTASGSNTAIPLSGPWVFESTGHVQYSPCERDCVRSCVISLYGNANNDLPMRIAMFNAYQPGLATCEANTITINWDGATSASVSANSAGSVTYGGDIRTPQSAIHVPGKVFDGWEFSTTAPQNPVTE